MLVSEPNVSRLNLPHADQARVDREKITDYLLNPVHPDASGKADFFGRFGFRVEQWWILADALRRHGAGHPVANMVESAYGTRYNIEGVLETPDGRNPRARTVWILEQESTAPRLITAFPI